MNEIFDDVDKLFELWEISFDKLSMNIDRKDIAEVNFDSMLAKAIGDQKLATTADKIARGTPEVMCAKRELLEADRLVKVEQAKTKFLENRIQWLKLKLRIEYKITGG